MWVTVVLAGAVLALMMAGMKRLMRGAQLDRDIGRFVRDGVPLAPEDEPVVRAWHVRRDRGSTIGYALGAPLYGLAVLGDGPQVASLFGLGVVAMVLGQTLGAAVAALTAMTDHGPRRAATLLPRRLEAYVPPVFTAVATAAVAGPLLALALGLRLLQAGHPAWVPVLVAAAVAGLLWAVLGVAAARVLARPVAARRAGLLPWAELGRAQLLRDLVEARAMAPVAVSAGALSWAVLDAGALPEGARPWLGALVVTGAVAVLALLGLGEWRDRGLSWFRSHAGAGRDGLERSRPEVAT